MRGWVFQAGDGRRKAQLLFLTTKRLVDTALFTAAAAFKAAQGHAVGCDIGCADGGLYWPRVVSFTSLSVSIAVARLSFASAVARILKISVPAIQSVAFSPKGSYLVRIDILLY